MMPQIERKGWYTRIRYNGVTWYIWEPDSPGVLNHGEGRLVLNLQTEPNLAEIYPNGAYLRRVGSQIRKIETKIIIDTIDEKFK